MKSTICTILFFIVSFNLYAQTYDITGKITDEKGIPLIGANLIVKGTVIGTATNSRGEFILRRIKSGIYTLTASMIGYQTTSVDIDLNEKYIDKLEIKLIKTSLQYDQVIVTASKYKEEIKNLPVSALVINSERINEKNFITLDQALRYAPGVNVIQDQVSIRGSSGYSLGAGTRVLTAIDGIPLYTGDSGEIIWQILPPTEIESIEVVKGAASSMYGTTAMGGVVNVISKSITSSPLTYIKTFAGAYSKPSHDEWKWSDDLQSYYGLSLSHSRSIGNFGFTALFSYFKDNGYRNNDWEERFSGYLKAAYNFSEFTSLTLIGTGYTRDKGTFTYWKGLNDALLPPDDEIGQLTPSDRYMVGLLFKHMFNQDISMLIKPSLYSSYWRDDSESSNSSKSNLYRTEVQINFKLSEKSLLISGIEGQHNIVVSSIFGDRLSNGLGLYAQWEYRLLESLRLSVGARYDYLKLDSLNGEGDVSPKIGLNYEMNDATILRASAGKGFRMPTLAEAFTSTTTSGISVKPNPDLKSETVYSFEIGGNHKFTEEFFIDLALFDNEYYDLIEPGIDPADGKIVFENVTRARVAGLELAGTLSFLSNDLTVKAGYTYLNTEDSSTGKELKYRPKHSLVVTVDYTAGLFLCGADFRYSSRVEEIDDELVDFGLVPDGDERVDIIVLDLRAGANLLINKLPLRIFLNLNNILNYNYVEMIGNLSPIRNYVLSVDFLF